MVHIVKIIQYVLPVSDASTTLVIIVGTCCAALDYRSAVYCNNSLEDAFFHRIKSLVSGRRIAV